MLQYKEFCKVMNLNNKEKNTFAQNLVIEATIKLLSDKELSEITISEISSVSGVSRVTIYRNFPTKEVILKSKLFSIFSYWIKYHLHPSTREETDTMLAKMFSIILENKELFLLLQKRNLLYLFREILKDVFGPSKNQENFVAYVSAFYFSGIFGWIEEWINRGMMESADIMEEFLRNRTIE